MLLQQEMEKAYQLININPSLEFVAEKLANAQLRLTEVGNQIEDKEAKLKSLETIENDFYQSREEIKSLVARLQTPGDNDLYKLRSQVAAPIKSSRANFTRIAPLGNAPVVAKAIKELESITRTQITRQR